MSTQGRNSTAVPARVTAPAWATRAAGLRYEPIVTAWLRDEALRDLFFLKSLKTWHFAYIYDFQIYLKTVQENYEKSIFEPVISGELAY